jgi:hypothetical protein
LKFSEPGKLRPQAGVVEGGDKAFNDENEPGVLRGVITACLVTHCPVTELAFVQIALA